MKEVLLIGKMPRFPLTIGLLCLVLFGSQALAVAAFAGEVEPIDKELDKYWNVEQAVPSLTNPLFERKGGIEGSLHFGIVPNDSYYLPTPVGGRVAYFLADTLALEASFSYLPGGDSKLQKFLKCPDTGKCKSNLTEGAKKQPHMNFLSALDLAWAPFHGKVGVFTSKLSNFDLGFNAGLGLINVDVDNSSDGNDKLPDGTAAVKAQMTPGGHWGMNLRFYITRWLNLRADYKQFMYRPEADKSFLFPVEFTIGVAFLSK